MNKKTGNNLNVEERKILEFLNKQDSTISELSALVDKSELGIVQLIINLQQKGFDIVFDRASKLVRISRHTNQQNSLDLNISDIGVYRFAVISDTWLGHYSQQLTLLHTAYKLFERLKVHFVLHAGNLVAGKQSKKYPDEFYITLTFAKKM